MDDFKPKIEMISIRDIHEDQDNPNAMDNDTFEALVNSIQTTKGMIEPIVTMECECDIIDKPHRRIVGGEHRWRAAQDERIGFSKIPCIDFLPSEEYDEKFLMVNMNLIKGQIIPLRMARLITMLNEKIPIAKLKEKMHLSDKQYIEYVGREEAIKQGISEQETEKEKKAINKSGESEKESRSIVGKVMFILQMEKLDKEFVDEAINRYVELTKGQIEGNVRSIALGHICNMYLVDHPSEQ